MAKKHVSSRPIGQGLEKMEDRKLMAVTAGVQSGKLVINADSNGGTVDVATVGNQIKVNGRGAALSFSTTGIRSLVFNGSAKGDTFNNKTAIDSTIYGNAGDDILRGGAGADQIYGGAGMDRLEGGIGPPTQIVGGPPGFVVGVGLRPGVKVILTPRNDLYGGDQNDTLISGNGYDGVYGEGGDDRLFGIGGVLDGGDGNDGLIGNVSLRGGNGADRFLNRGSAKLLDYNGRYDALINISDRNLPWSRGELEQVDKAFQELQNAAKGSTWILKDTFTDDPLFFTKTTPGSLGKNIVGRNQITWSPFDFDREIRIVDWDENSSSENFDARGTVIHEIGHNWDGTSFPFVYTDNPLWEDFALLHKASQKRDQLSNVDYESPDFARDYGQTSSGDDWSTMWELKFGYLPNRPAISSPVLRAKIALVEAFFAK